MEIFSAFIQEFRNWESAWALEALYVIVYEVRVLAEKVCVMLSCIYVYILMRILVGNNVIFFYLSSIFVFLLLSFHF